MQTAGAALLGAALGLVPAAAHTAPPLDPDDASVSFLPTPQAVVDGMFDLAGVHPGDVLYDLGAGDGRILIAAATRFGIRAVGIEINPRMVEIARANVRRAGVEKLVEIRQGDVLDRGQGRVDHPQPFCGEPARCHPGKAVRRRGDAFADPPPGEIGADAVVGDHDHPVGADVRRPAALASKGEGKGRGDSGGEPTEHGCLQHQAMVA